MIGCTPWGADVTVIDGYALQGSTPVKLQFEDPDMPYDTSVSYTHLDVYKRQAVAQLLLPVFLPFNLLKAGLNAALTFVLYRPAVSALGRSGLIHRAGQSPRRHPAGPLLAAGLAAVTCVLLILSMNGTI